MRISEETDVSIRGDVQRQIFDLKYYEAYFSHPVGTVMGCTPTNTGYACMGGPKQIAPAIYIQIPLTYTERILFSEIKYSSITTLPSPDGAYATGTVG
jgi:hypothetical protein